MEEFLQKENNSEIYFNGSKWNTNNCGEIEIIGKSVKLGYYICKFEDNFIIEAQIDCIKNGKIRNPNSPSVYGIGFIGMGKYLSSIDNKKTKEYRIWMSMLQRCYDEKSLTRHPTYIGCIVDKRWHNFSNFCDDIKELEGYNEWKNNKKIKYALDKDIKIKGNKIYSKDTCKFVTISNNITEANKRTKITGKTYIATRILDNYQEEFVNQSEFARKYNISASSICSILNGKGKSTSGWTFKNKKNLTFY